MSVILILLLASMFLALCFLGAFLWSVKQGQFDDPVTPAMRILMDDDSSTRESSPPEHT